MMTEDSSRITGENYTSDCLSNKKKICVDKSIHHEHLERVLRENKSGTEFYFFRSTVSVLQEWYTVFKPEFSA